MADELPEVGAFNQEPTLADVGKSSAATSLGSIGSLINLLTAKNTTDNLPEYMNILSPDFKPSATDLPDIEYFKEMFGAPESLNIGDFVSIDPFSKVLAGGKGIMAMVPFINKDGLNVTKLLETIRQIKNRATSTRNAARSSENINLKEAEYRAADKIDLDAKKLESQLTPEDIINEKKHMAAQSTKEESNKALAEIRKNLGIDPKKKNYSKGDEVSGVGQPNFLADTLSNVPSSAYQFGSDVAQVVTNPVQTLDAIGNLGLGLIALAIPDAYQEEKLDKPQEAAMAVGQYISDRYGGFDKVKETLRTDPVGMLADVSGVLLGGGYLATKAGLKAGQVATKAGIATDPLVIAGKGVSEVGKGITRRDVLKGAGAGLASLAVPMSMMTDVTKAIPPVAKSTGILAGIGKFKGIMNNLEPYLLGSKRRDQMNPGKYGSNKRAEAIDELYPEIGYNDSVNSTLDGSAIRPQNENIRKFQKSYNLKPEDFSVINESRMSGGIQFNREIFNDKKIKDMSKSIINVKDTFKKLDFAPDKKVTVKNVFSFGQNKEYRLTTGTVDGVPIIKREIYVEFHDGKMIKGAVEFLIPNEAGLAKLAKAKPKLAKGGSVDKALYTDQKYI